MIDQVSDWFSPSVTQHVALALTHSLWQGMIVAFAVDIVLRLIRDKTAAPETDRLGRSAHTRANLRYKIACMGLLVMAALPIANLTLLEAATEHVARAQAVAETPAPEPQVNEPAALAGPAVQSAAVPEGVDGVETKPAVGESLPGQGIERGSAEAGVAATSWVRQLALQVFFWVWFAGVSLLSAWHLAGWLLSQRFRRGETPSRAVLTLLEQTALRLGIRRTIDVRQSDNATTPMVIGWIKPAVILPAKLLASLAPRELEAVLAHELAHVRRRDYLANLIQTVVETLMFYHPGVWWVSGRVRCEREFCADDLAMRVFAERETYAQSLVAVAETALAPAAHAVAATDGSLLPRIQRILRLGTEPFPLPWSAKCSALVGVAAAAVCLSVALIAVAEGQTDRNQGAQNNIAREPDEDAQQHGETVRTGAPDEPAAEDPIPDDIGYRIDRTTQTRQWQAMVLRAGTLPQMRSGRGQMTLMRVVLEGATPGVPVQLESTKLVLPDNGSGGRFLQIRNGDFVLVEHVNSSRRKDGKDPVEIGSFTHRRSTIWVDVPKRGELAVLGDVILAPVPQARMGRIVATAATDAVRQIKMSQLQVGPITVGAAYGEAIPLRPNLPADTGKIAPGTYKILLPDFDVQKSRWTVEVEPGKVTRLQFAVRSQREIEKVAEEHVPEPAPNQAVSASAYGEELVKLFPRPATDGVQGRDAAPSDRTLVATVFGKPLYLDQVTPASVEVKRKELPRAEFDEWLRAYRGQLIYLNVWRPVRQKYVEREGISITEEDRAGIAEFAAREMEPIPQAQRAPGMTPEKHRAMMTTFWGACLMDWKVCKALYEKHGGRVGMGSLGAWIAFDAQNALLREHLKAGDIEFHHAEMEKAFWEHTKIKNFADVYPKGERLKQYLATPPYLRHRAREKSE